MFYKILPRITVILQNSYFLSTKILLITLIKTIIKYFIALRGEIKRSIKFILSMYSKSNFNAIFYQYC